MLDENEIDSYVIQSLQQDLMRQIEVFHDKKVAHACLTLLEYYMPREDFNDFLLQIVHGLIRGK